MITRPVLKRLSALNVRLRGGGHDKSRPRVELPRYVSQPPGRVLFRQGFVARQPETLPCGLDECCWSWEVIPTQDQKCSQFRTSRDRSKCCRLADWLLETWS